MPTIDDLLNKNRAWSEKIRENDPEFFPTLAKQQNPDFLWIGCSDSRVPANQVVDMLPGELFVHRNVANMVVHTDLNLLSVLQFAVDVLKVEHVIVCGHYGCGGVRASLRNDKLGIIDNWLLEIKDLAHQNHKALAALENEDARVNHLCELNVKRQVKNLAHTTIVQDCWDRGQPLSVHGWVYGLDNGLVNDLNVTMSSKEQLAEIYQYQL